jgi:hypothetical protein
MQEADFRFDPQTQAQRAEVLVEITREPSHDKRFAWIEHISLQWPKDLPPCHP